MSVTGKPNPAAIWKPLVVCPNAAIAGRLAQALDQIAARPAALVSEYPRMGTAAALAAGKGANICFLDAATNSGHAQMLIGELAASMPVVALLARNDADLILRCLRRGACEFLPDISAESVRGVLDRLHRTQSVDPHPAASGSLWCVVPGKPGCGASTLALHLAVQARAHGKVLLVDTDSLAASVAFQLKLKPEFHLGDVLRDWKRMDQDLWTRFIVSSGGIDVLAAPEDPSVPCDPGKSAAELCLFWRERYQTIVVDLGDVRAAAESGLAALADTVLVVTTNELAAPQTTRRALQCLELAAPGRGRVRLLLNRYTPATGLKREDVQKALGIEPFATVSNDYETIQASLLEGRPAAEGSRFASSIKALYHQLHEPAPAPKKLSSWLGSLLARR